MENNRISRAGSLTLAHIPTFMLAIGYPVYWLELYLFKPPPGQTTLLAPILFGIIAAWIVVRSFPNLFVGCRQWREDFRDWSIGRKTYCLIGFSFVLLISACAFYAALLPPHLSQEFDSLQYHYMVPRQHLILTSFDQIPWAVEDLYVLPLDFALAPYWFATSLPNKIPQFLFFCGLIAVTLRLLGHFPGMNLIHKCVFMFALFGSHHIGIQMGTAMLDLVICYLFLAALESYLSGRKLCFVLEAVFFFWAKPFIPLQMIVIICLVVFLGNVLNKTRNFKTKLWTGLSRDGRRVLLDRIFWIGFIVLSGLVAGPFLVKSIFYTGTPLYPFAPGLIGPLSGVDPSSGHWHSIIEASRIMMTEIKDGYGHGRSVKDFIRHFWLVAVPEKGVNNSFDYPLGLVYLLVLGPFLFELGRSLKRKQYPLIGMFVVGYWLTWWLGSQQSRFLYIPVILMIITCIAHMERPSRVFMTAVLIALLFNTVSVARAHRLDLGRSSSQVLRDQDRKLLEMNQKYQKGGSQGMVPLNFHDVTFARFPVRVTPEKLPHTLAL